MNTLTNTNGRHLTPPADFPVEWNQPEDAKLHWTRDREHLPDPITPMFLSVTAIIASEGYQRTTPVYEEAIVVRQDRTINTYEYLHLVPFTGTPEEVEARAQRYRNKMVAICSRLDKVWENEWHPAIKAIWQFWDSFDLAGASLPELCAHLEETLVRGANLYEVHYLMGSPMWFAIDEFATFYCDLFPGTTTLDAHRLLQGFDNKTLEIGRALWRLSRLAKASPTVCQALGNLPAADVLAALQDSKESQDFLSELHTFLSNYGCRCNLWDWGYPSWEDDPTPIINNIKNYIAQPDRDLQAERAKAAAERDAAITQARQELIGYPQPVVDRFEKLLKEAQIALVLTENHTYYIDFNGLGRIRRIIREFGKRFAAQGQLTSPEDIFYLKLDELRAMAAKPTCNLSKLALARRAEAEYWARYDEPTELGTRPAESIYLYSADARRMMRYAGGLIADGPLPAPEEGLLRGQAGSPGKVRGTARLIRSLAEAHRLQAGDILVTTTTAPPWTPLFLTAAAVVTDAGGLLSHGAVVSREYGIPAVVGTHYATARITDGQMIEVDGDNGVVSFL